MDHKIFESEDLTLTYEVTGDGPPIHFAHANGFHAAVYEPIIRELAKNHRVYALNICSLNRCGASCEIRPARIESWFQVADEQIAFLENIVREPVIGIGHSIGGVATMLGSIKKPELYRKIILLDPVLLPKKIVRYIWILHLLGNRSRMPLAARARKRRDGWDTREQAYTYLKDKPLFASWHDECLRAYVEAGLYDAPGGGVKLLCPPEIEAQAFESYPANIWSYVKRIKKPAVIIRGAESDTLMPDAWRLLARLCPGVTMTEIPGAGHLFPMEKPSETVKLLIDSLHS